MIRAKRIYEPTPKKEEQIDLQKIIADAFQSSISKAEKVSTWVSLEIEKENKIIERILYKIEDKLKAMKIDKSGVTEDVYNQLSSSLKSLWEYLLNIVNNHEHDYLTSEDKDECISIAETMVNEAVLKFDNLIKPFSDKFLRDLESKADKEHSHDELDEIMKDIEENEEELERKLETKADKEHKHEIEDVTWLSETLKGFANKEHKHDQYATVEQLNMVSMHRSRWAGWWGHVIQTSGVVLAQRSNMNFIWATVTDDPNNNATVVTITWWSGSWDVVWPASATDWNIALYDWATGKLIKNSTYSPASFAPALTSDENYVTDAEKIIISATTASYTTADETKVDFITVTQAVNLDTMESDIAALANGMVYKWNRDASAWTFPWGWTAQTWRFYTVSVGGTVDAVVFNVDDRIVATIDNASATTYAGNWTKLDATDAVTSVFGRLWNVVATNWDYTASQITNVAAGGISAITVQAAIDELDSEKAPKTSPTFWTSITGSYLTASEILITDSSKNIVSAPVATYPSLTELAYVKWVTSAIQTQLNAKQASDADLTDLATKWTAASASWPASLQFAEDTDNGTNKVTIQSPATLAADYTLTLPADDWTSGQYLKTDWSWVLSWDTPAWWSTLWLWYSLTWTYVSTSTFTFSWDAWDAEAIERSLFTCLSSADARKIWYVKSASHSAWTVTVTVVTDADLASWDNTFKVAINRKIEDYQYLFTVPWEQIADASNPQGIFYRSLIDTYLLPVNSFVRTAAAGSGAACAWNVYKWTTNLFTSAQDMTTATTFDEKRPNTNTITAWDIITLRVTSSAWATNKASDLQVQAFIVPTTLYTTAD